MINTKIESFPFVGPSQNGPCQVSGASGRQLRRVSTLCIFLAVPICVVSIAAPVSADEEKPIVPEAIKLGRPVDFAKDIAPIFRANCVACHNKAKSEGQLILENTAAILKGGSSGAVIVPGKPDESYLYQVAARIEESYMPPMPNEVQARKLTPKEVGLLRQWITEGAKAGASASAATMNWQAINTGLNAIYAVDTGPFGRFVAAGRAGNIKVYDLLAKDNIAAVVDPSLARDGSPQQKAHRDYVHAIAFHPGGQMFASAGFQVVKLWKREVATALKPWNAMPGKIVKVCGSPDGLVTAIQFEDGQIATHSGAAAATHSKVSGYPPAEWTLLGVGGPENSRLIVGGVDGVVKLLDASSGMELGVSEAIGAKSIDGTYVDTGNKVVVLVEDGTLRALTLKAEEKKLTAADPMKSDKGAIKQVAIAGAMLLCRVEGKVVELRKTDSLQVAVTIQSATPNASAAISANAERVLTVSPDGIAELWNAKDAKIVATLNQDLLKARSLNQHTVHKTVRDSRVAVVKKQVTEDEKRVTEQKESLKKADEEVKKATEGLAAAKKKADEEAPKVAAAKKASEEKPDDAGLKKKLEAAQKAETTAKDALTAAENTLKSANKGVELSKQAITRAEARVAERKTLLASVEAEAKASAESHAAAVTAAKQTVTSSFGTFVGNAFVTTVDATGTVRIWKAADGAAVDVLPGSLAEAAKPISITGGPSTIFILQTGGRASLVNAMPEWKLTKILGPQGANKPSVFVDRVLSLAFGPGGKVLAAGGGEASRSGELTLWNVDDGKLIRTFEDAHSDTVYGLDFSRDGKLLASAAADKFVKVFDLATGEHVRSYEGHTHHVMDVSWKGDGTQLISAGADNAIKVWNAETGEQARTISTYKKQVTALEFIGMEDDFISCSGDKRVFRHKAANGGTVREFKGCPDYVYCSATTSDGMIVAAGCEDGVLRIWNGKDGKELATFAPQP